MRSCSGSSCPKARNGPTCLRATPRPDNMAEFTLKYADANGAIHNQVAEGASEQELRDRLSQQGFLVYSVKPHGSIAGFSTGSSRKKINIEKFLIFNQQFVTLI